MPPQTALWKVGREPARLSTSALASEHLLEDMIVTAPEVLSDEWMLIGRQQNTGFGGRVDLVAIAPDASLVLIELKREKTPREVVAQALDYATWLETLTFEEISNMYRSFSDGGDLVAAFKRRFGTDLSLDELNQSHQLIVVASSLDESTERIVTYLSRRDVPINVLMFQVFTLGTEQVLSRTWLVDPVQTQVSSTAAGTGFGAPWNGEFYCSFGEGKERSWTDAVRYGFFSAGGGVWYSRTLRVLKPGDRIWAKIPSRGFVGVGIVSGQVVMARDFQVDGPSGCQSILDLGLRADYHAQYRDDPEKAEYLIAVKWIETVPVEEAVYEAGFFGNQNSVCQPMAAKWQTTVDRLKQIFKKWDAQS